MLVYFTGLLDTSHLLDLNHIIIIFFNLTGLCFVKIAVILP